MRKADKISAQKKRHLKFKDLSEEVKLQMVDMFDEYEFITIKQHFYDKGININFIIFQEIMYCYKGLTDIPLVQYDYLILDFKYFVYNWTIRQHRKGYGMTALSRLVKEEFGVRVHENTVKFWLKNKRNRRTKDELSKQNA